MAQDKKTDCLEGLRKRILTLDIAPGAPLDEALLSDEYGISRTPLREVLQRLSGEGYVEIVENRGAKATSMDLMVLRTFFETAPLIYATIARQAAENRKTIEVETLKTAQKAFLAAISAGDAGKAALENHRFHATIGQMAHNPYLLASLNRMLIDHTRLSQTFYRPATLPEERRVAQAGQQHDAMIAAIEGHDPEAAVALTLQHWDLSRDQIERFVRPDPLPLDVIALKDQRNAV